MNQRHYLWYLQANPTVTNTKMEHVSSTFTSTLLIQGSVALFFAKPSGALISKDTLDWSLALVALEKQRLSWGIFDYFARITFWSHYSRCYQSDLYKCPKHVYRWHYRSICWLYGRQNAMHFNKLGQLSLISLDTWATPSTYRHSRKYVSAWLTAVKIQTYRKRSVYWCMYYTASIQSTIDVQTKKKSWLVERRHWRHSIGLNWVPLSENTDVHPPKNEPLSKEMHLKIPHFSSGLKMSGDVAKLLITYLWNGYHQQIPGIKLIQIGAISILLCQH
jgi:hypothetical protein